MISRDCIITVNDNKATIDSDIYLYKYDKNIQLSFTIVNSKYVYDTADTNNLIKSMEAAYAQVKFQKDSSLDVEIEFDIQATRKGAVLLTINEELTDEDTELGEYTIQIRLFDSNKTSVVTLPPVEGCIHIQEPLFDVNATSVVNNAVVNKAVTRYATPLSATTEDGTFNSKTWVDKDRITTAELNRMETGIKTNSVQIKENQINLNNIKNKIERISNKIEPALMDMSRLYFSDGTLPTSKTAIMMKFDYYSKTKEYHGWAEIKCQGTSSMAYPKKNFTIKLYKDKAKTQKLEIDFKGWGKQYKFCLKANWIDISHARNIVSARLWGDVIKTRSDYKTAIPDLLKTSPNQGAIDGFPVLVYSNGVYQGRYTLNIPKDKWMSNMDDTLDTHCILCGENFESGCFRKLPVINGSDWTDELHDVVPASIKTSWTNAINFVMTSSDDEFTTNLSNYFDVNSLIDYYLYGLVSTNLDGFGKNQLYFTYDGVHWIASVYDLDSTWGLYWNGSKILPTDYRRNQYEDYKHSSSNLLYKRLEQLYKTQLKARYAELRKSVLSASHIIQKFEEFNEVCPKDIVQEDYANTTGDGKFTDIPSKTTNNIQQLRNNIVRRFTYVDDYVNTIGELVSCSSITLNKNTLQLGAVPDTPPDTTTNLLKGVTWQDGILDDNTGEIKFGIDKYVTDIKLPATGLYTLSANVAYTNFKIFVFNSNNQLIQNDKGDSLSVYVYEPNCHISISIFPNSLDFDANNVSLKYVHNLANTADKDVDIQANVIANLSLVTTSGDSTVIELYATTTYNDVAAIKVGSTIYKVYNYNNKNLRKEQAAISLNRANNGYCTKGNYKNRTFFNIAVPATWGTTKEAIANYIQTNNISIVINPSEYLNSADKASTTTINNYQLESTIKPDNCTDFVVWSVAPKGIVTVDNGLVQVVTNGEAVVTATCDTKSANCNVTVSGLS